MENDAGEFVLYKGKNLSSLFKDIVINSSNKRDQIDILVSDLRGLIKTPNDAMTIVPLLKEYLDVGVKNDEQLIKLAAIVQRIVTTRTTTSPEGDTATFSLTPEEIRQLEDQISKVNSEPSKKDV